MSSCCKFVVYQEEKKTFEHRHDDQNADAVAKKKSVHERSLSKNRHGNGQGNGHGMVSEYHAGDFPCPIIGSATLSLPGCSIGFQDLIGIGPLKQGQKRHVKCISRLVYRF